MVAHRNQADLSGFFLAQGRRWCRGVTVVMTDGSKSYGAAVERHLGPATHVPDRFHVVRWFATGLTLVRREAQRREPGGQVRPVIERPVHHAEVVNLNVDSYRLKDRDLGRVPTDDAA